MGESKQFRTLSGHLIKLTKHTESLFTIEVFEPDGTRSFYLPVAYADKAETFYKSLCSVGGTANGHATQQFTN